MLMFWFPVNVPVGPQKAGRLLTSAWPPRRRRPDINGKYLAA
jgi:hypothetical protein